MVALETASILCLAHAFTEKCLVVNMGHMQMSVLICSGRYTPCQSHSF